MKTKKIFVSGHRGMVGSAILQNLQSNGYENIITKTRQELDLLDQKSVDHFFKNESIDIVIICAAKVGGILANNTHRADFIYENLQISSNIIKSSHDHNVEKLINLGSSCIYPRDARIPIKEEYLLTGPLESTNEPYAIAKIAALKMCESFHKQYGNNFYSIMPCNLYGPNDNFDLKSSHVLPALINKIYCAKIKGSSSIEVWGSGKPLREFLFVDDLASAVIKCLEVVDASDIYDSGISHLNCGSNDEVSILELANAIKSIIEYSGELVFDPSKPDGTFRKKMDNTRITNLGFSQKYNLKSGIEKTYDWYIKNINNDC
jgi:GDP-L-fucose synthase